MRMAADFLQKQPARGPGRRFEKGKSGNPLGRRVGCRNRTTIAAAMKAATAVFERVKELAARPVHLAPLAGRGRNLRVCARIPGEGRRALSQTADGRTNVKRLLTPTLSPQPGRGRVARL